MTSYKIGIPNASALTLLKMLARESEPPEFVAWYNSDGRTPINIGRILNCGRTYFGEMVLPKYMRPKDGKPQIWRLLGNKFVPSAELCKDWGGGMSLEKLVEKTEALTDTFATTDWDLELKDTGLLFDMKSAGLARVLMNDQAKRYYLVQELYSKCVWEIKAHPHWLASTANPGVIRAERGFLDDNNLIAHTMCIRTHSYALGALEVALVSGTDRHARR